MEPDKPINPNTNMSLVLPIRENEKDNIVSLNVPPSVTEIELSFNSKDPPPHAEDEGNRPLNLNHPARLIIKLNVFNNPLKNNTPSNDPPSITEIDPPSNDPPSNEPDKTINPNTNMSLVPPIRENEKDNIMSLNVPPSVIEIQLSFNSKHPPPHAEDEGNRPLNLNHPARLIIKLNVFNNPLKNNTPSNDPPSNEPPSITKIENRLLEAAISGKSSVFKHLVLQNPKIDLLGTTPQGSTCLHISSLFGHENFCTDVLAVNQSLLSAVDANGETPLIVSVKSGHVSLASAMLEQYQRLQLSEMILKQDNNGDNALHHAIRNGHSDLALKLIEAECDLSRGENEYNESPMYIAVLRGFNDVSETLLDIPMSSHVSPLSENALHAAVRKKNPDIAKKIVAARPWLAKEPDRDGNTPMQLGVLWNRLDEIRVLLEHDRSLGYLINFVSGIPLLVLAALQDDVGVAQEILKYCPDAPYSRPDGRTMLHQAVLKGHEKFVKYILKTPQLHKLINMRNKDGDTALHIAVQKCNPNIVHALLDHKATQLTVINNRGITAEGLLRTNSYRAKTFNWNEVLMMMLKASPEALTAIPCQEIKEELTYKSIQEIKSLTKTYTSKTSLIAILIATITFSAVFSLPGGYSIYHESEGLPVLVRKPAFKAFLISDTLALCSSLAVAFICILARWEDLEFLLYYRSVTNKLMWFAYMATSVAFATGLYTVVAPCILWLAILICTVSIGFPFLTKLLGEWRLLKLQVQLGHKSEFLDMV